MRQFICGKRISGTKSVEKTANFGCPLTVKGKENVIKVRKLKVLKLLA